MAVTPSSLRRTLVSAAVGVDGVSEARATIHRRRVRLEVTSALRHTDGLREAAAATERRLDALSLRTPITLTARLSRKAS